MTPLKNLAIQYALNSNWLAASSINQKLLEQNPNDIDTLNRLGFALIKLGKFRQAKEVYKKVIVIDKTNPIALKNLKKIDNISKQKISSLSNSNGAPYNFQIDDLFIEEAGKTKTIDLKNIADRNTLSLLQAGDKIKIVIKRSKIFIQNVDGKYVGMLPDNISARLVSFIKGGNEYHGCIKSVSETQVTIFIKEVKRSSRFKNQPSFSTTFFSQSLVNNY